MTREYKFRGKSMEHGWVYGDLLQYPNGEVYIMEHSDGQDLSYPVDPDTVGQFTGLHDCNGKEIYEGDLLEVANHKRDKECIADVIFLDGEFWLHFPNEDLLNIKEVSECWVVIGNVHDHPELLKGGK